MANLKQVVYLTQADYAALLNDTHDPKQYTKNGKTIYFDPNTLYITESTVSMSELNGVLPVNKGGTGTTTLTAGQLLVGNGTNAVSTKVIASTITNDANTVPSTQAVYNNALLKSGGTMTGVLVAKGGQYDDSITSTTSHAINMNNSNIIGLNSIYTCDASDNASEGIHFYRDSTHFDSLWASGGDLLFVPNRALGTSTTKANSQKVGRFTANPTSGQVVITDGTTGGMKSSGYTIAKSVPSDADFTNTWRPIGTGATDAAAGNHTHNYAGSSSAGGTADSAEKVGNSTIWVYPNSNNEIDFGGTGDSTTIYIGYRSKDSRPVPTKFIFGEGTGTADLQVKTVYLGSGTTSYISSTQYTGNAATATAFSAAKTIELTGGVTGTASSTGGWSISTTLSTASSSNKGGIKVDGGGLTMDGEKIKHSNSVSAQTTQAVYPIKIDAQGHISAYGTAATILSLGTTSSTAYRGDYGNTAYSHATDSSRLTTAKSSGLYKISTTAQGHIAGATEVTSADITALVDLSSLGLSNAMHFKGITTTQMSDGLTTAAVTIDGSSYTPSAGDVVLYSDSEFVWTGSTWERLGRDSSFKTTQTAVSDPTASGNTTSFIDTISQNTNGVITATKKTIPAASDNTAGIMKLGASGGAATYGHTHTLSIADGASGDTNQKTLAASTKYKLTAGGSTYVFTTPPNTTSFTITANATDGLWDLTGTNGTNAVTYAIAPYSAKDSSNARFYTAATNPTLTTRLNYDGYFYATKLYSGGTEVLTAHQTYTSFTGKPTSNQTPSFGGTFTIQQISQNTSGQVSGTDRTVTIPSTIATNTAVGLVKPWYTHTAASTGPTTGNNATAVTVNAISTTAGKYYAVEGDSNGRLFVNVPWSDNNTDTQVTNTLNTSSKYYFTGTTSTSTNTGTQIFDTGVYSTAIAGELSAVRHSFNLSGTEKAYVVWNDTDKSLDFIFI